MPQKVYSNCRHQLIHRQKERDMSPIRIEVCLNDSRMWVLGNKSLIRQVQGLDSTTDSECEYVLSKTQGSTYRSTTPTRHSEVHPRRSP
ncbi:unnamed protein product [Prunus brigantina]